MADIRMQNWESNCKLQNYDIVKFDVLVNLLYGYSTFHFVPHNCKDICSLKNFVLSHFSHSENLISKKLIIEMKPQSTQFPLCYL